MPIPQDPGWPSSKTTPPDQHLKDKIMMRTWSEESIRTQDCDGPVPDVPMKESLEVPEDHDTDAELGGNICTDRAELMERIKRGESPTWVPNQALRQEYLRTNNGESPISDRKSVEPRKPCPLLPAVELQTITKVHPGTLNGQSVSSPEIERPRSALHAGDFTLDHAGENGTVQESPHGSRCPSETLHDGPLGTSPTTPWYTPPSSFRSFGPSHRFSPQDTTNADFGRRPLRSRAPSLNSYHSSSYVLKAPTTPLVQQSNNTDLDFSPRDRSISPEKGSRRRTLPPHAFHNIHSGNLWATSGQPTRHSPSYRRESSFPYTHQPRRSLTSNWSLQASSSPQTPPGLRSRRTSFNSESSPLQHASMVGSYEESILRGWMSTAPSRPLDFTAQIGVLGRGSCKPKCPPHISVPFPAVYYNWSAGNGRSAIKDDPSPYVGHIDLQQSLTPAESKETPVSEVDNNAESTNSNRDESESKAAAIDLGIRKAKKRRRTSPSSEPPKGSYRIPQQGQLQIIIKNPNKTAVKLFLVPYDLEGMEPGTKTFVRQRSYSADSVIDGPPVQMTSGLASLSKKSTLRYLIHLNICSPSKGRFYLYHQIRVVFANRVPDNKEQLRNEIQVSQPRFNAYRPNRESLLGPSSSTGAKLAAEKAYRRRSSGFGFGVDELDSQATRTIGGSTFPLNDGPVPPIPAMPFTVTVARQRPTNSDRINDDDAMELDTSRPTTSGDPQSPLSDKSNRLVGVQLSSSHKSNSSQKSDGYNKLSKGDSGYGGVFGRPGTPEPGEGLLARRLKGLGGQRDTKSTEDDL